MLAKVRSQWEYFMVAMSEMTCMIHESGVDEYAVSAQKHAYECSDFCGRVCAYFTHLMHTAAQIHKFESMPVLSIPPRWDMTKMENMEEDILRMVLSIRAVQENMKIAGASYGHDGLTQPTDGDDAFEAPDEASTTLVQVKAKQVIQKATLETTQPCISVGEMVKHHHTKRQIIYMKMRRRERSNLLVLSEEKYCYGKAVFEPVVEHLAGLSSPSFYAALKSWREIVNKGMKQVGFMPANVMARHNRRKKGKQTLLKSSLKPRKLAVMSLPDKQVPSLCRVLEWASHTTDRFHVSELLNNCPVIMEDDFMGSRTAQCERGYVVTDDDDYNYVIPKSLVTKLEAVLEAE
ncbi:Hypothetical protein PHPALM_875 [Phytophthora palmivora]|uniref:Uncharacterized protein n=1 Tax=Phytophthora palmivora TaxID=4796 RepID=A0A2P4YTR8_9STRA|nr:Hypothetical protein PHPALM_875 [Phytophthora palmivora]